MNDPDPLIRTKLRPPLVRQNLVARPLLRERLAVGLRGPLTLVTAPAGFGKTTLAAACLAGCGLPVGWLALEKEDNQPARFLKYLTAALRAAGPEVGVEAGQLLAGMPPAPIATVVTSLINDLERCGRELVVALDDAHLLTGAEVRGALTFLVEHLPPNLHLLILSRSDPALPVSRLRARGQALELRAADLRFTREETASFLRDVMGLDLPAEAVAALEERTEGWAAGLQMAALSMRDRKDVRGFIESFSGTNRYILDYLLEEVLAGQPPEIQRFLFLSSILDTFTPPLCDAIVDEEIRGRSAAILEDLVRANLFVMALDDERRWYRYHQLFADLLRARLQQSEPETTPLLHIRASAWMESNGYIPEAVQHLFAAHESARAAELIEPYGPARWADSDPSIVEMADRLPPEVLRARPKLALYLAWLLICQGKIPRASPLLQELAASDEACAQGVGWVRTVAGLALAFLAPPGSPYAGGPLPEYDILDDIPARELILRNAADLLYGMLLERRGELDRAAEVGARCVERERTSQGGTGLPTMVTFLAVMYTMQGRLRAAAELCREALAPVEEKGIQLVITAGNLNVVLSGVLYEWNHLDEAERHAREGLALNAPWGNVMTDALGLLTLVRVQMAKGDYTGALRSVDRFEVCIREGSQPVEFAGELHSLRARVQLAAGEVAAVSAWAEQVLAGEDYRAHPAWYRVVLAQLRLAQGRYDEAAAFLENGPTSLTTGNRIAEQIEATLLLAAARAGQGRDREASALVESCLELGESEGYVRVFVDAGQPIQALLAAYSAAPGGSRRAYAHRLLEVFSAPAQPAPLRSSPPDGLIEALTARELEVLPLMAQGLTNIEIADCLVIAPGTVKAHTAAIYRKLGAANRTEAAARARELGLLP